MATFDYTIAVICHQFSEFHTGFKVDIQPDGMYNGGYVKDRFLYKRVGNVDHIRGERFNGYFVYGKWKDGHARMEDYLQIMDAIQYCFSE